jgi:hypothetical protein
MGLAILCLGLAIMLSSVLLFSRAAATAQFLSGCHWRHMRGLGKFVQHCARDRATRREHGDRKVGSPFPPTFRGGRSRSYRYPHGSPRKPHDDPPLPTDVPLEPTFLGNVFAASRQRILHTDGLYLQGCWHVLLAVLPQEHRVRLEVTSAALLSRAQAVTWSVVSVVWAVWLPDLTWKALWVLGCLVGAYGGYRGMCAAAGSYCDQMEAIVSVNRPLLYEKLGLPPVMLTPDQQRKRQERFGIKGPYSLPGPGSLTWPPVPETGVTDSRPDLSTSVTAVLARGMIWAS